jgi:hypothetical protein
MDHHPEMRRSSLTWSDKLSLAQFLADGPRSIFKTAGESGIVSAWYEFGAELRRTAISIGETECIQLYWFFNSAADANASNCLLRHVQCKKECPNGGESVPEIAWPDISVSLYELHNGGAHSAAEHTVLIDEQLKSGVFCIDRRTALDQPNSECLLSAGSYFRVSRNAKWGRSLMTWYAPNDVRSAMWIEHWGALKSIITSSKPNHDFTERYSIEPFDDYLDLHTTDMSILRGEIDQFCRS